MKSLFSPGAFNLTIDPARVVFSQPDQYVLELQVAFEDSNPTMDETKVDTVVFIDDLSLKLYGTAYGILGTDHWGRDIWSQMVYGARISLFVGLFAAFIGVVIGLVIGLAAGYVGRIVDEILMRSTDILLANVAASAGVDRRSGALADKPHNSYWLPRVDGLRKGSKVTSSQP